MRTAPSRQPQEFRKRLEGPNELEEVRRRVGFLYGVLDEAEGLFVDVPLEDRPEHADLDGAALLGAVELAVAVLAPMELIELAAGMAPPREAPEFIGQLSRDDVDAEAEFLGLFAGEGEILR